MAVTLEIGTTDSQKLGPRKGKSVVVEVGSGVLEGQQNVCDQKQMAYRNVYFMEWGCLKILLKKESLLLFLVKEGGGTR
jgi:hypothetical protein